MQIVIIDDGLYPSQLKTFTAKVYPYVVENDVVSYETSLVTDNQINHGTLCSAIINEYCICKEYISIKILHGADGTGYLNDLLIALEWCLAKRVKIIHMSIGTTRILEFQRLYQIINRLVGTGAVIVAANTNANTVAAPSCFPNVIGVMCDTECNGNFYAPARGEYQDRIYFRASSKHSIPLATGHILKLGCANSYAAPVITAKVFEILSKKPEYTFNQVLANLFFSINEDASRAISCRVNFISCPTKCDNIEYTLFSDEFDGSALAWNFNKHKAYLASKANQFPSSIEKITLPVILIIGNPSSAFYVASKLKQHLFSQGYPTLTVTELKMKPYCQAMYLPEIQMYTDYLQFWIDMISYSLIIIVSKNEILGYDLSVRVINSLGKSRLSISSDKASLFLGDGVDDEILQIIISKLKE